MSALLRVSRVIDWLNERVGRTVLWLVLAAVLISTANALVRKLFDIGSNAYLEVQWYLFSAVFLLCSGYTLMRNEHVRIDIVVHQFSRRVQVMVDIFGLLVFLLPAALLMMWLAWPMFVNAYVSGEMSQNAGGLIRWPVYLLMPAGFLLLALQGVSELIKRIAFLQGRIPDPGARKSQKTAEEELAEAIKAETQAPGARK
jgi:TRAP-type mannitol/chloroaromatic compound transport system permease small subunit